LPQAEKEVIEHWAHIGYCQGLARAEQRIIAEIQELASQLEELKQNNNENPTSSVE